VHEVIDGNHAELYKDSGEPDKAALIAKEAEKK